ncbi:MAG: FAD-dependent oxidoreductase [Negativicutes bacterium]|nr:FAD-dependent oxidoreductase [Negativicutes bacterium]
MQESPLNIVVVGAVAAGMKAASKARRCDSRARITVLEKGELISYGACGMPYYVEGEVKELDELMKTSAGYLRDIAYFQEVKNIDVQTGITATRIDRSAKTLFANKADGSECCFPYDKLVLATGALPLTLPIPGAELQNILPLWHPRQAQAVDRGIANGQYKKAVIIGAGLVGIEMAEALAIRGLEVTVVEMKEQIFPAFLDPGMAKALEKYLRNKGVRIFTQEKVLRFEGKDTVSGVVTDTQIIPADLVITGVGVKPNIELAAAAGLEIGSAGGIIVDECLRTTDPDIYAGGDCVENIHLISGKKLLTPMGSTANKHGRVIGANVCGGDLRFKGVLASVIVKVFDINVGAVGLNESEAVSMGIDYVASVITAFDKPHYMSGARTLTLKLIVDSKTRKILGAQAYGRSDVSKRLDVIAMALTVGGSLEDLFDADLTYAPPFNSPIDPVAVAANVVMNKLDGKFTGISPLMGKAEAEIGTVFLDVRTDRETARSRLAGCRQKHIPLHELRCRLDEIDFGADIITFCSFGLRGYEAALILQEAGFMGVKNLEGGTTAWPFDFEK